MKKNDTYSRIILFVLLCNLCSVAKNNESILNFRQIDFGLINNSTDFSNKSEYELGYSQNILKSTNVALSINKFDVSLGGAYGWNSQNNDLLSSAIRFSIANSSDTIEVEFKTDILKGYYKEVKDSVNKEDVFPEMIQSTTELDVNRKLFGNVGLLSLRDTSDVKNIFGYVFHIKSGITNYRLQNGYIYSSLKNIEISKIRNDSIKYFNNTMVNASIALSAQMRALNLFINPNIGIGIMYGISKSSDRNISWFNNGIRGDVSLNVGYKSKHYTIGMITLLNANSMQMFQNIDLSYGLVALNCYYRYTI